MEIWETLAFHSGFSVSETAVLVFQSRTDFARELAWTDASGHEEGRIQGGYWEPHISPDGRFVVLSSDEFHDGKWYICVHDIERGVTTRLTDGGHEWHPSWSADGKRITYDSLEGHMSCTYEIAADGSGPRNYWNVTVWVRLRLAMVPWFLRALGEEVLDLWHVFRATTR